LVEELEDVIVLEVEAVGAVVGRMAAEDESVTEPW
jgi:hypothetical protein